MSAPRIGESFNEASVSTARLWIVRKPDKLKMSPTTQNRVWAAALGIVVAGFFLFFVYVGYQEIVAGHYPRAAKALVLPAALVVAAVIHFVKKVERS
jgi:hypothetical protein